MPSTRTNTQATTYYSISMTMDNKLFFNSDSYFLNYEDALYEFNRLTSSSASDTFHIYIVTSKVTSKFGGVVESDDEPLPPLPLAKPTSEINLTGYHFKRFGKGFMLYPKDGTSDTYYGEKYFVNGWWNTRHKAWFFKSEYMPMLMDLGATETGRCRKRKTSESAVDLSGRYYDTYGRGFLLYPTSTSDPLYGQKYLLSGFWNDSAKGWFFRSRFEPELQTHGALPFETDTQEHTHAPVRVNTHIRFDDDAEILETDPEDEDYVPEAEEELDEDSEEELEEELDEDLRDMILLKYGKGYILKAHRRDERFGEKYFLGGFWNSKVNGWFFKKDMKRTLRDMGAKYIRFKV